MMTKTGGEGSGEDRDSMRAFMGPGVVDQEIRQAIMMCWTALPAERKTVEPWKAKSVESSRER